MQQKVLLAGDVDAIKEFVFETSSLPQIRGGSELLLECEEQIRGALKQKYGYDIIYCGGGSFLLEVEAERAEEVKKAIERQYLETTQAVTVTIVYEDSSSIDHLPASEGDRWAKRLVQASAEALKAGTFSRRAWALAARMREAKLGKDTAPFYESFPFGRRCDRCGKRMAVSPDPIEPDKTLCPVCEARDSQGRKRENVYGQGIRGRFNRDFWQTYGANYSASQPEDLDTLLSSARRKYLAFIYADGNDIGRLLRSVRSETEYRALSAALAEGTKHAVYRAVRDTCTGILQSGDVWPFDIVNIGGDDVVLLVQAGYAWEIGVRFLEHFEEEVNRWAKEALGGWPEGWPERITSSCGIAIADVKYPVRYLERLASDLLREAKRLAKREQNRPQSAITFLWLPTPVASEKAEPLMGFYRHFSEDLTARPYTLKQAKKLLMVVREMVNWPRTLRHRWAESLEKGVMASVNLIHYDIARRDDRERKMYQTLVALGQIVLPEGTEHIPAPIWYQAQWGNRTIWRTALLDALELAELEATRPDAKEELE